MRRQYPETTFFVLLHIMFSLHACSYQNRVLMWACIGENRIPVAENLPDDSITDIAEILGI